MLTLNLDVPDYASWQDVVDYTESYADHFGIKDRFRLGAEIDLVKRSKDDTKWMISYTQSTSGSSSEEFDRVVVTTGPFHTGFMPKVEGAEEFQGKILHAQGYNE